MSKTEFSVLRQGEIPIRKIWAKADGDVIDKIPVFG